MKKRLNLLPAVALTTIALVAAAGIWFAAAGPRLCIGNELDDLHMRETSRMKAAEENRFAHRPLKYPFDAHHSLNKSPAGTQRSFGFDVDILVAPDGRTQCAAPDLNEWARIDGLPVTLKRLFHLRDARSWRYPAAGVTTYAIAHVPEEELPARHVPMPVATPNDTSLSLTRSPGILLRPYYRVTVWGNGRVVYEELTENSPAEPKAIAMTREYAIDPAEAQGLIKAAGEADLWSLRSAYEPNVLDAPTNEISMTVAGKTKSLKEQSGEYAGMPHAISLLEDQIDAVAKTRQWQVPARGPQ